MFLNNKHTRVNEYIKHISNAPLNLSNSTASAAPAENSVGWRQRWCEMGILNVSLKALEKMESSDNHSDTNKNAIYGIIIFTLQKMVWKEIQEHWLINGIEEPSKEEIN